MQDKIRLIIFKLKYVNLLLYMQQSMYNCIFKYKCAVSVHVKVQYDASEKIIFYIKDMGGNRVE